LPQNFLVLRKDSGVVLGVDLPAINFDVEDPSGALDQFRIDAFGVPNGIRQTGGFGQVVSLSTVGNANLHRFSYFSFVS
jgi:hypothetical protein